MEDLRGAKPKRRLSRNVLVILGFFFAIAIIALITVGVTQNKSLPENVKFGIVLDAGSSHTGLYVYKWPAEKENDTGVVQQVAVCKVQGPGISGYAQEVDKVGAPLGQCMEKAKEVIPEQQYSETPVYLGATAGMRLLRLENSTLAEEVLSAVEKSLGSYPFDFQGARIITGKEEGAYGWITINYLLGNFNQSSAWLKFLPKSWGSQETSGALDLGGASTQITFVPQKEDNESSDSSLHFHLYGKNYNIYTHSFLCYGKDQALRLKLTKSIQEAENGQLKDPCFHTGYKKVVKMSDLYSSPCTEKAESVLHLDELHIQGTGNFAQCQKSLENIFNTSFCSYSRCSFNGIFLPPVRGDFRAFSAFYFVMNFLNLTAKEGSSLKNVTKKIEDFCSRPWEEVKTSFSDIKEKYLSEYCFSGTYIVTLLHLRYGFTDENWKDIQFMGKIGDSDAGWTLGYMLNQTNMIPAEQAPSPPLSHPVYVFLMVAFSLLLVAVCLTGCLVFRWASCLQKGVV
ncbi:ectonucleoside triphosphate diphosphohydrolase 1 [Tachyglossus aculeatus]|uniref:ectonucleoside triphosphate diphosphohydrolase 1 n=1 Tax=Tachyglossus aculeatus TaxID=9261 RepID=UPI0018F72915|nr:ectonucleoside triphosphate diphosphohydrolase 1 [Tachyglossus aculeatus]